MSFISLVSSVRTALVSLTQPSNHTSERASAPPRPRTESLHGKNAAVVTSTLNERGHGEGMAQGVTNMNRKAYWQGRNDQQKIGKGR